MLDVAKILKIAKMLDSVKYWIAQSVGRRKKVECHKKLNRAKCWTSQKIVNVAK
jgi:hypothetical protein